MKIEKLILGSFGTCCYIVYENKTGFIIDPADDAKKIIKTVKDLDISIMGVLLTHGHFDHLLAVDEVAESFNCSIYIHELDVERLADPKKNASVECNCPPLSVKTTPITFKNDDVISLGDLDVRVIHTPGHTEGSSCFVCNDTYFTGDTVFKTGYGRTDFWGGDFTKLKISLKILLPMIKDKAVYPGHDY
ncbi:MAG: MBL fold metallo-hydrolase [Clostridia bacterium]|nr:MBL fold metallo-hydrolase [Clostridia bacterium]